MTFSVVAGDIDEAALAAGYRQALVLPEDDVPFWRRAVHHVRNRPDLRKGLIRLQV